MDRHNVTAMANSDSAPSLRAHNTPIILTNDLQRSSSARATPLLPPSMTHHPPPLQTPRRPRRKIGSIDHRRVNTLRVLAFTPLLSISSRRREMS